ncbi:MAG: response regulator transcription factor [Lachnospiraceae bacterium]|jgi:DNA-binding response OmpR family regulator|nr:response regulator transcription factor [Lachnospiraceae bacterium]
MKILLVEDNEAIILGLQYLLEQEGYTCQVARRRREAERMAAGETPDLLLLDIGLPDGDGYQLCQTFRQQYTFPVIFLTAREEEEDVVRAFDLGADDYIIKPFRNRELLSRIKNVLRRGGREQEVLQCGHITLEVESGRARVSGEEVTLTKLEYKILSSMMSCPGKLFTRDEILSDVWDISGNFVNDNTLSVTIKRLREKLGDGEGRIIKTVRGMGYRMER